MPSHAPSGVHGFGQGPPERRRALDRVLETMKDDAERAASLAES
jgi:hypothetical protein